MFIRYDSTFDGLLSAAAWCFRQGLRPEGLLSESDEQSLLESFAISREPGIRRLFQRHLSSRLGAEAGPAVLDTAYRAFLSEMDDIATRIWYFLDLALRLRLDPSDRLYEPPVAAVVGAARRVSGQAHQYLGLLRFRRVDPTLFMADFAPDYHVLPLILPHFADRLPDQNFVIRDLRRQLAALHRVDGRISLHVLAADGIPLAEHELPDPGRPALRQRSLTSGSSGGSPVRPPAGESRDSPDFAGMWRLYLQHLSIPERRNPALQQANLPKKYWKYLTEDPTTL